MHTDEETDGFEVIVNPQPQRPLIAAAIHDGHSVRSGLSDKLALDDLQQMREEDPFTGEWTEIAETRIIGLRSRFEVDLNRPREKAVYQLPDDAWGLTVWKDGLESEEVRVSLELYDDFYRRVEQLLQQALNTFPVLLVFDLHTYNHRREGPGSPPADPELNPEINVGTGTMDRKRWAPVVDRFISDLRSFNFAGRQLDVRENVRFRGGNFPRWIHQRFPERVCALAIEFKKFFMDEWTGVEDRQQIEALKRALLSTIPGVLAELKMYE